MHVNYGFNLVCFFLGGGGIYCIRIGLDKDKITITKINNYK